MSDSICSGLKRLEGYYFDEQPPHALCIFRILWGVYFLIAWLWKLPHVALFYSVEGMAFPYFEPPVGFPRSSYELIGLLTQPPSPTMAWVLYLLSGAVVLAFLVGYWTRLALIAHAAFYCYYYFLQMHLVESSFDRMLFVITVFLAMSQCDEVYSLRSRSRRKRGQLPSETIPMWPQRLVMLQIVFIYFGTGVYKIMTPDWAGGGILETSLMGSWATPVGFWFLNLDKPEATMSLIVLQTILMEVWSPFLLFHPVLRKLFFAWGVSFHIGIAIMLTIPPFLFMVTSYVLFADSHWVRSVCRAAERRFAPAETLSPTTPGVLLSPSKEWARTSKHEEAFPLFL